MKTFFLSTFLIVATVVTASAQLLPSFQFGIKGGANFSTLKEISLNSSSRTGYLFGVWTRIGGAGLHLQPELYVTSKGSDLRNDLGKAEVKFTTVDLPILLGTRVGLGPIAARIQAGPVVSFVMSEDDNWKDTANQLIDFKEYKNQTIGLTGGLGVDIMKLRADLRYEHGLSSVFKDETEKGKMSLWTVSIGYRLF